uniref:Uncharacterized protein n=2 Tax=Helianthus annuus TaxID=4232 RepID=A0A251TD15_HELAN
MFIIQGFFYCTSLGYNPSYLCTLVVSREMDEPSKVSSQHEEEVIKKKYGGIVPKKPPLISKVRFLKVKTIHELLLDYRL